MTKQKVKKCHSCQALFTARRDAKTCSATCRKRLQRNLENLKSQAAKMETSIEQEFHRLSAQLLPSHVWCEPLVVRDQAGSVPVTLAPPAPKHQISEPPDSTLSTKLYAPAKGRPGQVFRALSPQEVADSQHKTAQSSPWGQKVPELFEEPAARAESTQESPKSFAEHPRAEVAKQDLPSLVGHESVVLPDTPTNPVSDPLSFAPKVPATPIPKTSGPANPIAKALETESETPDEKPSRFSPRMAHVTLAVLILLVTTGLFAFTNHKANEQAQRLADARAEWQNAQDEDKISATINSISAQDLEVTGDTTLNQLTAEAATITDAEIINLLVHGATTLEGSLDVGGDSTLSDLLVNGRITLTGNEEDMLLISTTYDIQDGISIRNPGGAEVAAINASGGLYLAGNAEVGGNATIHGTLTVPEATITQLTTHTTNSTNTNTTNLTASKADIDEATIGTLDITNLAVAQDASVGDDLRVGDNLSVDGNLIVQGSSNLQGPATLDSTLDVNGATTLSSTLEVTGNTTVGGILSFDTFGTSDNANFLCRNAFNQLSLCNVAGSGAAYVQGGNSFGETAVLGTDDNFDLTFETSGNTVATLTTAGQLQLANSGSTAGILIGGDTNLYRSAANTLKTDDTLEIEASSGAAAIRTTVAAADSLIFNKLLSTDSAGAFRLFGDGKQEWGAGGSVGRDTNLYRSAANTLKTDDNLVVALDADIQGGDLTTTATTFNLLNATATTINFGGAVGAGGIVLAGGSGSAGCTLDGSTGNFTCSGNITGASTGTQGYWTRSGTTLSPATAGDNVQTSGNLQLTSDAGTATSGIRFGSTADTNLYRSAADTLRTDDSFIVGTNLTVNGTGGIRTNSVTAGNAAFQNFLVASDANPAVRLEGDGKIQWGPGGASAVDTNLYRSAADNLKTDDDFRAAGLSVGADAGTNLLQVQGNSTRYLQVDSSGRVTVRFDDNSTLAGPILQNLSTDVGAGVSIRSDLSYDGSTAVQGSSIRTIKEQLWTSTASTQDSSLLFLTTVNGSAIEAGRFTSAQQLQLPGTGSTAGLLIGGDTNLYRGVANGLRTDDQLQMSNASTTCTAYATGAAESCIWFSSDTNLYRSAANTLKTDDKLSIVTSDNSGAYGLSVYNSPASGSPQGIYSSVGQNGTNFIYSAALSNGTPFWGIQGNQKMVWGDGSGTFDTNLYRSAADTLKTDDKLVVASDFTVGASSADSTFISGTAGNITVTRTTSTNNAIQTKQNGDAVNRFQIAATGKHEWGDGTNAVDTNLYRGVAGELRTDSLFTVSRASSTNTAIQSYQTGDAQVRFNILANGTINWGSGSGAVDTNLYRSAANTLQTDDTFKSTANILANSGTANEIHLRSDGKLTFGSSEDTNLYRSAANILKTDDSLQVATNLGVGYDPSAISNGVAAFNGNVGIGNSSPTMALDITDSSQAGRGARLVNTLGPGLTFSDGVDDSYRLQMATNGDFTFLEGSSTTRLTIQKGGNVGIGATPANGLLTIGTNTTAASGGLYLGTDTNLYRSAADTLKTDDTFDALAYKVGGVAGTSATCAAGETLNGIAVSGGIVTAGTCTANGADLAEAYNSSDELEAGELVMVDSSGSGNSVLRANGNANKLLGVVSTQPDRVMGIDTVPNGYPIALSGRVPTKVSDEGGTIEPGDKITLSSAAGVGMKATGAGMIVGTALTGWSGPGEGTIEVFVHVSYYQPPSGDTLQSGSSTGSGDFSSLNVSGAADVGELNVTGTATIATLTVTGNATFAGNISLEGDLVLGSTSKVLGNSSTRGEVVISAGQTSETYTFPSAYSAVPNVVVTPTSDPGGNFWVSDITATGFSVYLGAAVASDVKFNFQVQQ